MVTLERAETGLWQREGVKEKLRAKEPGAALENGI